MKKATLLPGPSGTDIVVDELTGEVLGRNGGSGTLVFYNARAKIKEDWNYLFQEGIVKLAMKRLNERNLNVWLYMVGHMDYENKVLISQKKISVDLDIAQSAVSKILKELEADGLVIRDRHNGVSNKWIMASEYVFRGNIVHLPGRRVRDQKESLQKPPKPVE